MTEPDPIDNAASQFQDAGDEYVAWTPPHESREDCSSRRPAGHVVSAQIAAQREQGWPDFHPETYCHRCGGRNVDSWHAPDTIWQQVVGDRYEGIICPQCFTQMAEAAGIKPTVWKLVDGDATTTAAPDAQQEPVDPDSPEYRLRQARAVILADDHPTMTSAEFDEIAGWNAADLAREVLRLHEADDALVEQVARRLHRNCGPIPTTPWEDLPVEAQWSGHSQALYIAQATEALAALRGTS